MGSVRELINVFKREGRQASDFGESLCRRLLIVFGKSGELPFPILYAVTASLKTIAQTAKLSITPSQFFFALSDGSVDFAQSVL